MNKDQFWQIIHDVKQYCAGKDRESFACVRDPSGRGRIQEGRD